MINKAHIIYNNEVNSNIFTHILISCTSYYNTVKNLVTVIFYLREKSHFDNGFVIS